MTPGPGAYDFWFDGEPIVPGGTRFQAPEGSPYRKLHPDEGTGMIARTSLGLWLALGLLAGSGYAETPQPVPRAGRTVLVRRTVATFSPSESWQVHVPAKEVAELRLGKDGGLLECGPVEQMVQVPLVERRFGLKPVGDVQRVRLEAEMVEGEGLQFTIRFRDRDGEVGQLAGKNLDPGMTSLEWEVPAARHVGGTWGENRNGVLDPPVFLHELFAARLPSGRPAVVRLKSLQLFSRATVVDAVELDLRAGNEIRVVTPGDAEAPRLVLRNLATEEARLEVRAVTENYSSETVELTRSVAVPPQAGVDIPLSAPKGLGIHWVKATVTDPATGAQRSLERSYAAMAPAGPTRGRAKGFLFSICTHTERWPLDEQRLEVLAAALCGAKVIRTGYGWGGLEPEQGKLRWEEMDRLVRMYGEQGMEIQYMLGFTPRWAAPPDKQGSPDWLDWNRAMPRLDAWRGYVRRTARRYRSRIRFWEVWNEPDIGFWLGTLDEYLDILRAAHQEIKGVDPSLRVMTGGFAIYDRNPEFIEGVVERGQRSFDILAYHRHGSFAGFRQEVDGPLARLRARLRPPKPLYFNETAISSAYVGERFQAETLVKKLTFAWARGAIGYTWYDLRNDGFDPTEAEHNYGMVTNDFYPKAVYPTFNTLVTHLRGKEYAGEIDLGGRRWCFAFAGRGETALVAWNDARSAEEEYFLLDAGASSAWRLDMMGNLKPTAVLPGGRVALPVSPTPQFLVVRTRRRMPRLVGPLLAVREVSPAIPGRETRVELDVRNPAPVPQDIEVAWQAGGAIGGHAGSTKAAMAGDESQTVLLTIPVPLDAAVRYGESHRVRVAVTAGGGVPVAETRVRLDVALVVPGHGDGQTAHVTLTERDRVVSLFEADPNKKDLVWSGPDDLSVSAWLGATDDSLSLRLSVRDDVFRQPERGANVWQGDNVQVAFAAPGQNGYWELGLTRLDTGQPEVWCWTRPEPFANPAREVRLAVRKTGHGVVYDARLPLEAFGLTQEVLRAGIRLSFIVNDNDGQGREGWIRVSEGIGRQKDPGLFPYVVFE